MKKNNHLFIKFISISVIPILLLGILSSCLNFSDSHVTEFISESSFESFINHTSPLSYINEPLSGPYEVTRIVDGDTIIVNIDGIETRIRLIGIDTPESVSPDEELNTPEGEEASARMIEIIESANFEVYLEYDEEVHDKYERTLAYVYILDNNGDYLLPGSFVMVEEILLREGYADTLRIEPNTRYATFFEEI